MNEGSIDRAEGTWYIQGIAFVPRLEGNVETGYMPLILSVDR